MRITWDASPWAFIAVLDDGHARSVFSDAFSRKQLVRPGAPGSFLFLVVRPGAPSSVLAPIWWNPEKT